jgi:photosystem II stability/assembly factor-like uncharacterized protein
VEPIPRNTFLLNFTAGIMLGHGRPVLKNYITMFAILLASVIAVLGLPGRSVLADNAIATESLPIAWQDDAELTDVCFVDRNTGWAVGAQGVILRTTDGGKTWLQPSDVSVSAVQHQVNESHGKLPLSEKLARIEQGPRTRLSHRNVVADASRQEIRVRFESVHFVDAAHGWAAGGYNVPWMDRSRGLIMRTRDSGKTWRRIERLTIPRVKKIHFTNRQLGWAFGDVNALHPDGIYFTHDGGSTWSSQSSARMNAWTAGQQVGGSFVLIDQNGRLGLVTGGKLKRPALFGCSREDRITCLTMHDELNGFAVGRGGLVLRTTDGGNLWKRWSIDIGVTGSVRCMTMNQQNLFMALASGGLVRVDISDQSVHRIDLPTSVPIQTIAFVNKEAGFAVGDCGTILSTVDGGQNWRKQRGAHDRLAMLFVARHAADVSLPLMAYNAGEESRLCGTFLMEDRSADRDAATQAFERVGSVVNWRTHANTQTEQTQSLVSAIRAFKPLAIVCCHDLSSADRYQDAISLQKSVQNSIELAANATAAGDQQRPWQVQRLISSDLAGSVRLDSRRMMPSMGLTVSDQAAVSRTLLGQSIRGENFSNWRVTHIGKNRPMKGNDFLAGLASRGAPVPVRKQRTALGNLNRLNHALARNKQSERLLNQHVESDQDLAAWRQGILNVMATTEENVAGLWLLDLAQQYLEAGRLKMVDLSLEALATYLSDHAFAPAANAWLTIKRSQDFHSARAASDALDGQSKTLDPFMRLTQYDPSLVLEPAWQWIELNLLARSSGLRSVEPKLAQLARLRVGDHPDQAFAKLAQQELAMLRSSSDSLAAADLREEIDSLNSSFAKERPKLDGHLDDELWENARAEGQVATFEIGSAKAGQGTDEIVFAYDGQFFYGAIHCHKLAGRSYRQRQGTRTRDPDLSQQDRVQLALDPGLNFCGAIKLTLDYRGWVSESKLAGKDWNPDWFVAAAQDDDTWSVEFAIPMAAISQRAPDQPTHRADTASRGWGVKVCRMIDHEQTVWPDVDQGVESLGASVELKGLQASLKPNPAGFRRLLFSSNPNLTTPVRDPLVRPAQYQLESNANANGDSGAAPKSDHFPVAPQVPNLDGSSGAVR